MARTGGRRPLRLILLGGAALAVVAGVGVVVLVMAVALFVGGASDPAPGAAGSEGSCGGPALPVLEAGPRIAALDADQTGNARAIVKVAAAQSAAHGLGPEDTRRAALIGIMTALQESTLRNLNYGDRDSLGLFQQRAAWASATERTTPDASATMFYLGGHAGQRGLFAIGGWQSMPLWAAAQAVQVSAFPTAYAKWERTAEAVVGALLGHAQPASAVPSAAPSVAPSVAPSGGLKLPDSVCAAGPGTGGGGATGRPVVATAGWSSPLPAGTFTPTSPFGWRMHPILHDWRLHTGQDLGAPMGTPVAAAGAGRVVVAGPDGGYGNVVVVQHADGVQSYYGHLSAILVPVGATVRAGQRVGLVGSTGTSTGAHLHFEIRLRGTPIDPVPFMRSRGVTLRP